jgi:hypothetical protein
MVATKRDVRFTPDSDRIADVAERLKGAIIGHSPGAFIRALFDNLVGPCEQHRGHVETERLRGFDVDDQFVLAGRLHG